MTHKCSYGYGKTWEYLRCGIVRNRCYTRLLDISMNEAEREVIFSKVTG